MCARVLACIQSLWTSAHSSYCHWNFPGEIPDVAPFPLWGIIRVSNLSCVSCIGGQTLILYLGGPISLFCTSAVLQIYHFLDSHKSDIIQYLFFFLCFKIKHCTYLKGLICNPSLWLPFSILNVHSFMPLSSWGIYIQANIGSIVGSVPDHCNKGSNKEVHVVLWFPRMGVQVMFIVC